MSELSGQEPPRELSMDLNIDDFYEVARGIYKDSSAELALPQFYDFIEAEATEESQDTEIKKGIAYKMAANVEADAGNYDRALDNLRAGRQLVQERDIDLEATLASNEAYTLVHKFYRPAEAIEPYETCVEIFERKFVETGEVGVVTDTDFQNHLSILSHLVGAYQATGQQEKLRASADKLFKLGGFPLPILGIDECEHGDGPHTVHDVQTAPLSEEIRHKLFSDDYKGILPDGLSESERKTEVEDLESLEKLIDNEAFLPEAPEQRDFILVETYRLLSSLVSNPLMQKNYLDRAERIAKKHRFAKAEVEILLVKSIIQSNYDSPTKTAKTLTRALGASDRLLELGAPISASRVQDIANLLMSIYTNTKDFAGIVKLQRRLEQRGLQMVSTRPSALNPNMN